jgi:cytochrome b561
MELDTQSKLSGKTRLLHWIVGVMMISLLSVGVYMEENEAFALYPWHKSFGVLIVVFVLWRIVWRIKSGWPTPVRDYRKVEKILAKVVQYVLIIGSILMPVSGFLMSVMGGQGVDFFGIELFARNPDPVNPMEVVAINGTVAKAAHVVHGELGEILIVAVLLHIVGALKHHVIDKDGTLRRMLGKSI